MRRIIRQRQLRARFFDGDLFADPAWDMLLDLTAARIEMKRVSGGEVRELEPAIGPNVYCGAFHGGWYFVTNPERVVKTIAADVMRNGGTVLGDDVMALEQSGGMVTALIVEE